MRNVYFIYIDPKERSTEILDHVSGEIKTVSGIDVLTYINLSKESVVFINFLNFIRSRYPGGEAQIHVKPDKTKEIVQYVYGKTTFRNITCFTNGSNELVLTDMFPDVPVTVAMQSFILSFNENPERVKNTLGYNCKKMFYEGIKDALWQEKKKNKAYYYSLETYQDMMTANKSGSMSDHQAYAEDVLCYDKRSAYASVIINDNHFPIGKMKRISFTDPKFAKDLISRYLKNEVYCKLIVDHKVRGFADYYDYDEDKTALEYDNFLDIIEDGQYDIFFENISSGRIYKSDKTGYCADVLRSAVHDAYIRKESATGVEKFFLKTQLNINIYGKSIQKYDFNDKKDVQKHYRGRGDNYLNPEMGLHCQAVLKHELHKAQRNNIPVYWDTDGIKVLDTPEAREYFESQNGIILKKNEESGYPCNIGTWKLEAFAKKFVTFGCKRYLYEDENGEVNFTWNGMIERNKTVILSGLGDDVVSGAIKKGIPEIQMRYFTDGNFLREVTVCNEIKMFEGVILCPKKRNQKQSQDTLKSNRCLKSIHQQDTTSSSECVEREKRIQCSKNASVMQSTEKEFLHTLEDTKNRSKKPILMILSGRTITGLMGTLAVNGTELCTIDQDSTWSDGERTTMEPMIKKQETQILSVVRGH